MARMTTRGAAQRQRQPQIKKSPWLGVEGLEWQSRTKSTKSFHFDDLAKANILSFIKIYPKRLERSIEFKEGMYEIREKWSVFHLMPETNWEAMLDRDPRAVLISKVTPTQMVFSVLHLNEKGWRRLDEREIRKKILKCRRDNGKGLWRGKGKAEYVETGKNVIRAQDLVPISESVYAAAMSRMDTAM